VAVGVVAQVTASSSIEPSPSATETDKTAPKSSLVTASISSVKAATAVNQAELSTVSASSSG